VFLLGSRGRIAPAQLGLVSPNGRVTIVTVPRAPIGMRLSDSGDFEQRSPGLAVDASTRTAYLFSGDRVASVDLETRSVTDPGPLRTLAKVLKATYRSASWLGDGLAAVSGFDQGAGKRAPTGLRIVDLRAGTTRTIDPNASSFSRVGNLLLVDQQLGRRALSMTAYRRDGSVRYRLEVAGATWMKTHGMLGYACRDAMLRAVVDLRSGRLLHQVAADHARCATVLVGNSRS
jgi:hypothetical protein